MTSDEFTEGSYNFVTNIDGSITKRPTDVLYNTSPLAAVGRDQFEAIFENGVHHLLEMVAGSLYYTTGDRNVSLAKAGYTAAASMEYAMYQNRVYYCNGVNNAEVYDLTTSYGGVSYTFPTQTIKAMGAQAPVTGPTFAADTAGGSVPVGGHFYKVSFLYYGFEESNGGTASALHTVANPNNTVNLTAIPVGGYGVTARKVYRDNNDGNFRLVGTISNNTATTFQDTASSGTTVAPTTNNVPPVFSYIALNLSRLWVAGVSGTPTTIYWSSPGLPDIFDPDNFVLCNPKDPIQAVYIYQGVTYVLNRHSFGRITGTVDDNFAYEEFPGFVGCVDNRSIQIRTIDGVPTLIWLSDRGFYKFNGSSAEYISDPIEDLVNLNIQQVNFVTNSNNQSSLADFQAGVYTAGIDLLSNPGSITTVDPTETFQSQADWEGGLSLVNIATADGSNQLKVPTMFSTTLAAGSVTGAALVSGSNLVLPTIADFTGQTNMGTSSSLPGGGFGVSPTPITAYAQPISAPTYAGTITSLTIRAIYGGATRNIKTTVWADSLGQPGSILYQSGDHSITADQTITETVSISISAGQKFWIGFTTSGAAGGEAFLDFAASAFSDGTPKIFLGSSWVAPTTGIFLSASLLQSNRVGYVFSQTAIVSSGSWTSTVYDSFSIGSAVSASVVNTGSFPATTSGILYVDESNDSNMNTGITTFSQANPNGTYSPGLTNKRYWRLRYDLATTDNRNTPSVTVPALTFNTTGTWISQAIDCTTDVTSYNAITSTTSVPGGTTVTITVATSPDNVTYSSFVAVGSAVVQRYVKVRVVLTTTSDNASTPSVSLLVFSWNLSSTFTSSIINVGQVPSGWGLFQDVETVGNGTITFYMRSAASPGAIPGATFYAVTNGTFPNANILPLQYTQWRIVFTTSSGTLPSVDSVTVNWFLGNNQSPIRTASLFFDRTYYCAAAETNEAANNIVICFDQEQNWRLFRNININALGLFFNQPFYLDAVRPNIYQWLVQPNGMGDPIEMVIRTKAFDMNKPLQLKNVRGLVVSGINTGTTIHAYYSVDRGASWIEMLNSSGVAGYTTGSDLNKFIEYFVPNYELGAVVSGVTVMYQVTSVDAYPCSVLSLQPQMYIRSGKYLGRPL